MPSAGAPGRPALPGRLTASLPLTQPSWLRPTDSNSTLADFPHIDPTRLAAAGPSAGWALEVCLEHIDGLVNLGVECLVGQLVVEVDGQGGKGQRSCPPPPSHFPLFSSMLTK